MSTCLGAACMAQTTPSGPVTINSKNNVTIENLHITSTSGNCLTITNSTGVIIRNSEIGPCGRNGIVVSGGNGVSILDNYIHPESTGVVCCDSGDGIYGLNTTDINVQGNVIAYGESNIELINTNTSNITGNFLVNPRNYGGSRGSNVQVWNSQSPTITNNYALASVNPLLYLFPANQSDSINVGYVNQAVIANNYITGGFWSNGCGIIADSGANNVQIRNNSLVDTGACGIGIADGVNQIVDSNQVINSTPVINGGNTAIYVWKVYSSDPPCGPVQITNNVASELKPNLVTESGFWNGGGCAPVTLSGNTFDAAARARLYPPSSKLPPPLIPPQPSACVIASPFSNQTAFPACNGQAVAPPSAPASNPASTPAAGAPVSDGFDSTSLNTGLWTLVNPVGNGSYSMTGTEMILNVPAASNHDPAYGGTDNAVRVLQSTGNSDFTVEVKFDSIPLLQYQFEGIIVQQDSANYLRFNFGSAGNVLDVTASKILSGSETYLVGGAISLPRGTQSLWLRIQKAGVTWTETWSADGSTYNTVGSFNQALSPSGIGPFAGNFASPVSNAPAFNAYVDYFSNLASPAK